MNFEYNGNLEEGKRIFKVATEIIKQYPEIDMDKASMIATLEEPITTDVNPIMHFKRLYNILFVVQYNKKIFNKVLKDTVNLYNLFIVSNDDNGVIRKIMNELVKYVNGKRFNFPVMSEFIF